MDCQNVQWIDLFSKIFSISIMIMKYVDCSEKDALKTNSSHLMGKFYSNNIIKVKWEIECGFYFLFLNKQVFKSLHSKISELIVECHQRKCIYIWRTVCFCFTEINKCFLLKSLKFLFYSFRFYTNKMQYLKVLTVWLWF